MWFKGCDLNGIKSDEGTKTLEFDSEESEEAIVDWERKSDILGETVNHSFQPEYNQDVYNYLCGLELKHQPKNNYMVKQPDITHMMRGILVDWLVEVSEEFRLKTETLYLAVSYIDTFLSLMPVERAKLQLVGTAALFIASKFEQIYPPPVSWFVYITDNTYNKKQVMLSFLLHTITPCSQVLWMEYDMLQVLEFEVSVPTSHLFVSKLSQMAGCDDRTTSFAIYLNELSLMSLDFLQFTPSKVAAASVALARHTLGQTIWPESMSKSSGHSMRDLQACLLMLHQGHTAAELCPQQAIRKKYMDSNLHSVSVIAPAVLTTSLTNVYQYQW